MSELDPATANLMADLQYLNESSTTKIAEDMGAPTLGLGATDYITTMIDEDVALLKQANDLRDGVIDEATIKSAEDACDDKGDGKGDGKKDDYKKDMGKADAKKDMPYDKKDDDKTAADLIAPKLGEHTPSFGDLNYWMEQGPEPVRQAFGEAFMDEMHKHAEAFGEAYDKLLDLVVV